MTSTAPDLVGKATQAFERILGAALPRTESLDLIRIGGRNNGRHRALNWRKACYSANGGATASRSARPGTRARPRHPGPCRPGAAVLPGAWRRFAEQVKRSLAPGLPGCGCAWKGHPGVAGVPLRRVWGVSSRAGRGGARGVGGVVCGFPSVPGSAWYGESVVARGARPRAGEGGRGSGGTGNRALGGSGFPRCLQLPPAGRCGAVCAAGAVHFPRSFARRVRSWFAGEAGMGVWGKTWNRAVVFRGRGAPGFPQCVSGLVPPPACLLA